MGVFFIRNRSAILQSMSKKKIAKKQPEHKKPLWKRILKWFLWVVAVFVVLIGLIWVAFQVSPWPSALFIRDMFTKNALEVSQALEKHVPSGVDATLNQQYKTDDKDAFLDVYYPHGATKQLPTIVWVHGGGWISGDKSDIGNYLKILAAKGYTTVSVGYSIAPEKSYPVPVIQTNEALGYINKNAERLHIDPKQIVLAGDSAGSQIAAQVATLTTNPSYAKDVGIKPSLSKDQLVGMLLNCGAYDIGIINSNGDSTGAKLLRSFLWSYSGKKNFMDDKDLMKASVVNYVTKDFPASFITAGNDDPLLQQSQVFSSKLHSLGVEVSDLFYPSNYSPALQHEYQFNLDTTAGTLALERMTQFLAAHTHQ
jgi:acetyl esterase